jgi:SMC interacting uncharacterized protein involved in chromosome segregation
MDSSSNSNVSCHDGHSSVLDDSSIEDDDVDVCLNYKAVSHEKLKEQAENYDRIIRQLQDEVTSKSSIVEELSTKVSSLQNLISEQAEKMSKMTARINQLNNHLNYFKKKSTDVQTELKSTSLPLDKAVVKVVNDLLLSQGRYKLMKKSNVASAVAKGIFHPSFLDGIVLPEVIKLSKNWL